MNKKVIDDVIKKAIEDEVFPGAAIASGTKDSILFSEVYGNRQLIPRKKIMTTNTMFDIASISKLVTTFIVLKLVEDGKLSLKDKITKFFNVPKDKEDITIEHLMTHTGGLAAHIMISDFTDDPKKVAEVILNSDLSYKLGEQVEYSCLGFILLGKIAEMAGGQDFDILANQIVFNPLSMNQSVYNPSPEFEYAVTEYDNEKGKWLEGVVHDENARFMGGVSGNAGVFSNLNDMQKFAQMLTRNGEPIISKKLFDQAITNHTKFSDEGRGLGFLVKHKTVISCGNIFGEGSFGHTGFTGTSIWVDINTGLYVVFLTNRVHPVRANTKLIEFRKVIHDTVISEYVS